MYFTAQKLFHHTVRVVIVPCFPCSSHVILDEVHERDVMTDIIMVLLKELLAQRSDIKVYIYSSSRHTTHSNHIIMVLLKELLAHRSDIKVYSSSRHTAHSNDIIMVLLKELLAQRSYIKVYSSSRHTAHTK